jgi:hypothetical protein
MKQYILPLLLLTLVSCNSFLEEEPKSSLPTEQAYNNINDLYNNALLDIYNHIGGKNDSQGLQGTGRGVFDFNSLTTDEAIMPTRGGDWYDSGFWQTLFLHSWDAGTPSQKDMWEYLFKMVMKCNQSIEHVQAFQATHQDKVLNSYIAELRAIRAMYYFYLMDLFGRVPLVTSTQVTTHEMTLAKRSETFHFIMRELLDAIPLLSTKFSNRPGSYYGRVTQPVVWFLLAKLLLNAEIYADDDWTDGVRTKGNDMVFTYRGRTLNAWQYCQLCCDNVTSYGYQLEPDFTKNFSTTNEESRENIFTIPMDPTRYNNWYCYFFRSRHYSHGAFLGGGSENGASATIELVNAFDYNTPSQDPRFTKTFYADVVLENRNVIYEDNGKNPLIYYPLEVKLDLTGSPYEKTAGARLHKYENDPNANADGRACHNDIVLFRYADVLLMKAEAMARNGEDGSAELNKVRERVGLPAIPATLENIIHERYLELAWEGWRRNDMIRYGIFARSYTDRPQLPGEDDGHTTVFPIPGDLLVMHPTWTQNPGY